MKVFIYGLLVAITFGLNLTPSSASQGYDEQWAGDANRVKSRFGKVGDSLYLFNGVLYFQITSLEKGLDGAVLPRAVYLSRFSPGFEPQEERAKSLSEVIDTDSWVRINEYFFGDKEHLYCHYPGPAGGFLMHIDNADPGKLRYVDFDRETDTQRSSLSKAYATDGQTVFYYCQEVENALPESFRVSSAADEEFDAYDTESSYLAGKRVR